MHNKSKAIATTDTNGKRAFVPGVCSYGVALPSGHRAAAARQGGDANDNGETVAHKRVQDNDSDKTGQAMVLDDAYTSSRDQATHSVDPPATQRPKIRPKAAANENQRARVAKMQ
jgi:hypothetical protein